MNDRSRQPMSAILRDAMVGAADWRLLTLFTITVLWTTVMATFPAWRVLASVLDSSPRAKEIASAFDLLAIQDMGMALYRSGASVTGAAALATLLGVFTWPFLAGMAIASARGPRPRTFADVIEGGVVYYARMLRVGLVAIVPYALFGVIAGVAYKGAHYHSQHSILESQATTGSRIAVALTFIAFVLVHATIELGRAAVGADDALRSGWSAWLRGVRLIARDPANVLGAYLVTTLASFAVATVLMIVRLRISGPSAAQLIFGFVAMQLAVASLGWGRAARLFALAALAEAHVPARMTTGAAEAPPDDEQAIPPGSMFRDLGPRKPVARRG